MTVLQRVFIALGSNLGDRRKNIETATEKLKCSPEINLIKVSGLLESDPVGGPPQGKFLDGAVEIRTTLSPRELLTLLKQIEKEVGRISSPVRWDPREIDLDILLFGDLKIDEQDLKIPHPLLHLRRFMLEPLCEIAPEVIHPVLEKSIVEIFSELGADRK
ncbi:MAG: 2-amino-4-hydroxy-6-hydroxymethyldihydropteridine diphosphokinase [Candidatus Omnitrophota bacterium]